MPTAVVETLNEAVSETVLREAIRGLTAEPKTLSPWLFYDERGSQLFEDITRLPEYYLTRTERAIFAEYGPSLPSRLGANATIAELGAGSASKTGLLLRNFVDQQSTLLYQPIDISPTALDEAEAAITAEISGVEVRSQVANYITERYSITRPPDHLVLVLYIGSSIGNFSPSEAHGILRNLRDHLEPGDFLLLGTDLAPSEHKSVAKLLAAYDDAAGVTAQFNKNILVRLNREADADFALKDFAHRARWNAAASRIEMHLESLIPQTVRLGEQRIEFSAGETIHTENSYKFDDKSLAALLDSAGFSAEQVMQDTEKRFAVTLARAT